MDKFFKRSARLLALVIAVLMAVFVFASCKLDNGDEANATAAPNKTEIPSDLDLDGTTVVMRSKNVEMTLYDFGQAFFNSQYYMYYMYGMMTPDQFCDSVIEETSDFMRIVNASIDDGIELTQEDLDEIDTTIDEQLESILQRYEEAVEDGAENKREEARKLLEEDLAQDGIDFDSFMELAKNNLRMYKLANKYYLKLEESMDVSEDEIFSYVNEQIEAEKTMTMSDYVAKFNDFISGSGPSPVTVPKDCFTVNHIFLSFDTDSDEEGNVVYNRESRHDDEARIEERLSEIGGFDEFMELESEFGEDPGMDEEGLRENGYMIHPDIESDYFAGFVYAAMNLKEGKWERPEDPDAKTQYDDPELLFFTLKDGTQVVKACTDSGVHYMIINKVFTEGEIAYEIGDERWESWKTAISRNLLSEEYDKLVEQWKELYPIEVDSVTIKAKYAAVEEPDENRK